jgi:hypothetical protein
MITSDRNVYIAAHVTQPVKDYLRQRRLETGKSVSILIFEMLEKEMEGTNDPIDEDGSEPSTTQH